MNRQAQLGVVRRSSSFTRSLAPMTKASSRGVEAAMLLGVEHAARRLHHRPDLHALGRAELAHQQRLDFLDLLRRVHLRDQHRVRRAARGGAEIVHAPGACRARSRGSPARACRSRRPCTAVDDFLAARPLSPPARPRPRDRESGCRRRASSPSPARAPSSPACTAPSGAGGDRTGRRRRSWNGNPRCWISDPWPRKAEASTRRGGLGDVLVEPRKLGFGFSLAPRSIRRLREQLV